MSTSIPRLTWFITGATSGLGQHIALAALSTNQRVIATSRHSPSSLPDSAVSLFHKTLPPEIVQKNLKWVKLDLLAPVDDLSNVVKEVEGLKWDDDDTENPQATTDKGIHILVNCAGSSMFGAVEDTSDAQTRHLFDLNFFGPLNLTRAFLPSLRARSQSLTPSPTAIPLTILNVSSSGGLLALPSVGIYAATKHAFEGATEALAAELSPFNIRVLLLEPGGFRTNLLGNAVVVEKTLGIEVEKGKWEGGSAYADGPAGVVMKLRDRMAGTQLGDPGRAGRTVVDVVLGRGVVVENALEGAVGLREQKPGGVIRVPIGSDCVTRVRGKLEAMLKSFEVLEPVWRSTDRRVEGETVVFDEVVKEQK